MTERFQIIHLGNPYDFVVKDHQTNRTYGTLQGDDKSLMELLNELHEEKQSVIDWIDNKIEEIKPYNSELCRATLLELKELIE